jgi:Xaa-Pro aminopeptidase
MKIKDLQEFLREKRISCAIFLNKGMDILNPNFSYLTGSNFSICLVISQDKSVLLASSIDYEEAKKELKGIKVVKTGKKFFDTLKKYAKGKTIGIDKRAMTLLEYAAVKKELKNRRFVDVSQICSRLRSVKTQKEIAILKQGCKISDSILASCFRNFRKFKTEQDVAFFLEFETKKKGCELSFKPIVASGSNSSQPHHTPKSIPLKKGFCVIDFGVKYKGYCTDTTRTIYLGKPGPKEKQVYDRLLKAQENTILSSKAGQKCSAVWQKCMDELGSYSKYMIHGLGHGVGVEIHELPNLKPKSKDVLLEGMVCTIEPGVYFPDRFGIRIEDTIYVSKKPVVLTRISKKLTVINK